jgi:superfamily II DNA/RNA helicase
MTTSVSARPQFDSSAPSGQPRRRRRRGRGGNGSINGSINGSAAGSAAIAPAPRTDRTPRTDQPAARSRRSTRPAGPAASVSAVAPVATRSAVSAGSSTLPTVEPALTGPSTGFAELGVPKALLPVLVGLGAPTPFPIQSATLPATLAGRDVLGRGKTGSGKTIAFAIPLVARLAAGRSTSGRPRGLVLLPTRELALQVARTIDPLAKAAGLRTVVIFGGVGYGNQTAALRRGVDIVIACPGRLEDLVNRRDCDLSGVQLTVLDEADHMADLGFLPVVRRLLRATPRDGQRLLFSATLDNGISVLVNEFLSDPVLHAVDEATSPVSAMEHHILAVDAVDRAAVIRELARGTGRRLLFTRTKHGAKKWAAALTKYGTPAVDLHGNLSQNARERNLAAFSSGAAKVLVATDIAARGIHVDDIELVVHLDPPVEHKAYLHRSGRTARAGAAGRVITVMLPDQRDDVRKLMKQAGITADTLRVTPGHPAIAQLAG